MERVKFREGDIWVDLSQKGKKGINYNSALKKIEILYRDYESFTSEWNFCFKVVAQLTTNPYYIDGVPLRKPDAELLADLEFPYEDFRGKNTGVDDEHTGQALRGAFVAGFEAAESTLFTKEDVKTLPTVLENYLKVKPIEHFGFDAQDFSEHFLACIYTLKKEK